MADNNMQNEYDEQTDFESGQNQKPGTSSNCLSCCCSYIKWSFKAACKLMECAFHCA